MNDTRKLSENAEFTDPSFEVKFRTSKKSQNHKIRQVSCSAINSSNPSSSRESSKNQDNIVFTLSSEEYFKGFIKLDRVQKLIQRIIRDKDNFSHHLKQDLSKDSIFLAVKIFAKTCEARVQNSKNEILEFFVIKKFQKSLKRFIKKTSKDEKGYIKNSRKDIQKFFYDLSIILKEIVNTNDKLLFDCIKRLFNVVNKYMPVFEEIHNFPIQQQTKDMFQQIAKAETGMDKLEDSRIENKLSENFRNIPIYLTPNELTSQPIPLQSNILDKPYKSVEHYLDLQFKLLREDFLRPLKEGIKNFTNFPYMNISDKVRIYEYVTFLAEEYRREHFCVKVSLDLSKAEIADILKNSKRFKYGFLLCFSSDNFRTIFFGQNLQFLSESQMIVEFRENFDTIDFDKEYTMVEYEVTSDNYCHILTGLKSSNESDFPLQKYVIKLNHNRTSPDYLGAATFTIETKEILPLKEWPNDLNFYNFSVSQMKAFKQALTQNLALIEGGPGTGKTYLGVKIAGTLINNKNHWYTSSPILLISNTISAVDGFLKGILKFTKQIVRVAGASRSFQAYNLNKKLSRSNDLSLKENQKSVIFKEIQELRDEIDNINRCQAIINFEEFGSENIIFTEGKEQILHWLFQECIEKDSCDEFDQLLSSYKATNHQVSENHNKTHLISLYELKVEIDQFEPDNKSKELETLLRKFNCLFHNLSTFKSGKIFKKPKSTNVENPFKMNSEERWSFYFYLLQNYQSKLTEKLSELCNHYRLNCHEYEELKSKETVQIFQASLVVCMTIMDATRLRKIIQLIKSPIVIVQEAAEILEAPLVTTLTKHCKHLILIGDTKQLKPWSNDYKLNKTHNIAFSLFERFIKNGFPFNVLSTQYRTPPNISALIKTIYPCLEDDSSTLNRPPPKGLFTNLFFINHKQVETSKGTSKKNDHEIKFLIKLAEYLVNCGNKCEAIAILAPYLEQVLEFKREMLKFQHHKQIRISTLDSFQKQESDIVLVSLSRNNKGRKMGFLRENRRIVPLLSRAKVGLYIMGNIDQLSDSSKTWKEIRKILEKQVSIGERLPFICPKHGGSSVYVAVSTDFGKLTRENGCNINCKEGDRH